MASLKSAMNMPNTIFIITTNHIDKVERGVINRCEEVEFNAAPAEDWLPLANRILKDMKVKGSSNTLKVGTKVRGIRLVDGPGDHDIEAKVDGFGSMNLKSSIVKKA